MTFAGFSRAKGREGARRVMLAALAAGLIVSLCAAASHGHGRFGDRPQSCVVCQVSLQQGEPPMPPEVSEPGRAVIVVPTIEALGRRPYVAQHRSRFSRAPPSDRF